MIRQALILVNLLGMGATAFWYVKGLRAMIRRQREPDVEKMSERQRGEFMQTAEYARIRNAVRWPMWATLFLGFVLMVLLRFPDF
jgi:hypothetical protein